MKDLFSALGISRNADEVAAGASQLAELGVRQGAPLLVHSAFRPMRPDAGRIEHVIGALAASVGDDGTLLIPSLSFDVVTRSNPVFDLESTPSCIGAIAEFFRTLPVSRRSMHPTHSVSAVGAAVEEMIGQHGRDTTPVGPHSPFRKLRDFGGQLLMLGCGLKPNTSMHGVEEYAEVPYVLGDPITYTLSDGKGQYTAVHRRHAFTRLEQRYDRVLGVLTPPEIRRGTVFGAECWLIEVVKLWERCAGRMAEDPYYFVESVVDPP